jgi:hypothetical protein
MRPARPAVHIERADAAGAQPVVLRTDVAGMVGIARRGPLDTPVPVESMRQFAAHFGDFTGAGYLAHAVRGFFENGGRRCWVVRVASRDAAVGAQAAALTMHDIDGRPALRIAASSAGSWGNALSLEWAQESGPTALATPSRSTALMAGVDTVAGFSRHDLVRIDQPGSAVRFRVIADVDDERRRIHWVHPDRGSRLPTDRPLDGIDPGRPLRISRIAWALTVRENSRVLAVHRNLHAVPGHPRHIARVLAPPDYRPFWLATDMRFAPQVADAADFADLWAPAAESGRAGRSADLPRPAEAIVVAPFDTDPTRIPVPLDFAPGVALPLAGGRDGLLALQPYDHLGEQSTPGDSDFSRRLKTRGLQALADIDEISLLAMPDLLIRPDTGPEYGLPVPPPFNPCLRCPPPEPRPAPRPAVATAELPPVFSDADIARAQSVLLTRCEDAGDRFAVLSLPFGLATGSRVSREQLHAWRRQFDSRHGALYAPWLDVPDPRDLGRMRRIPACGHLLGAIARTDLAAGVHRAPANLNLLGITDLSRHVDDEDHGELNAMSINAVRGEFGRPPVVGGARSLSFDPDWRYINIVRLVLAIRKAAQIALRWVVFEPNDHATRASVAATLDALLQLFHERGAFRGATAAESYFVRCDDVTTPFEARDNGRLIALVGVAPAAPCEFIVLRIGQERNALSVSLYEDTEALHA